MAFWARQASKSVYERFISASPNRRSCMVSCFFHFYRAPEEHSQPRHLLESKGTLQPLGFCKAKPSSRAGEEASLALGLSVVGLLLSTELSHAEDQDPSLRSLPEAKSNIHTAKWRIFTDKARDLCAQRSFDNAEKYFYKALEEAKLGFGEEDPHVASCYNNLAEFFRMKKEYDKAEPFYLEAVRRLRQSYGVADGSAGFALHNLGGFYLLQRKLDQAQGCYEEALKIKGRALGLDHPEYANTMFHLGEVIRLQGDVSDGLALIRDSITILEQIGLGNTRLAVKRLARLSELLVYSGQLGEAEGVQRKILQVLEFSKDFLPEDNATALENLIDTLRKQGKVDECQALLEQSISLRRKGNGGGDDIHAAASLLKLGEIYFEQGKESASKQENPRAVVMFDKAEGLLLEAVKTAELHLKEGYGRQGKRSTQVADTILLAHCLATLGDLRMQKLDILTDAESRWEIGASSEVVLRRAVSILEDLLMQQGTRALPEARKLHQECTQNLADLSGKKLKLQPRGH